MRQRLAPVRVRATLSAAVVVAITLAVAGVLLVTMLHRSQLRSIDSTLDLRVADIEALIATGSPLDSIAVEDASDGFVQVVDDEARVLVSSENLRGEALIVDREDDGHFTQKFPQIDTDEFRVRVHRTDGAVVDTIIVGINLEDVAQNVSLVTSALAVGLPMLLLLMAGMVWLVVGRALLPVEQIRAEVADIGGGDLHRRVPVPAATDEIGRLASTMNGMLDRLEAADIAQARFVSNASHELRTPIAVIRHELEIALRSDDHALLRQTAEDVLDEDMRMQRLVDDLLFLARREAGTPSPSIARALVDLDDIALTEAHRVTTTKVVDTSQVSAGQVRGDDDQLGRILRNLLDNALRHATSTVSITIDSVGGQVLMHVDDDGPGVGDADRELIFERFGRADEARARDDGGSGLGLAIVTELVADHHASIEVTTSPTLGGARFTVSFTDARL